MKILVTGSAGLVGHKLVKDLSSSHKVFSCYNKSKPEFGIPTKMDLLNHEIISNVLLETEPDVVIHLGAMTGVDSCEKEESMAFDINTKATQIIAEQCSILDKFLIYVSTDYVFDGNSSMYYEDASTNPLSIYGKSKLGGEKMVQEFSSNWCIARTSTPFGIHPTKKSFPTWIIENVKQKKQINIVTDQITSPTYVPNLCQMLMEISEKNINGIIHTSGATSISRYKMAELIFEKFNLDKTLLKAVSSDEMNWIAKRPKNSSLSTLLANSVLDKKPQSIEQSLNQFFDEIDSNDFNNNNSNN